MCGDFWNWGNVATNNHTSSTRKQKIDEELSRKVGAREVRKLKARRTRGHNILWAGLRMTGVVGWTVAIPTLIGVAIGKWLDQAWPARFSWTLSLLLAGVVIGCFHAWYWLRRESKHE